MGTDQESIGKTTGSEFTLKSTALILQVGVQAHCLLVLESTSKSTFPE